MQFVWVGKTPHMQVHCYKCYIPQINILYLLHHINRQSIIPDRLLLIDFYQYRLPCVYKTIFKTVVIRCACNFESIYNLTKQRHQIQRSVSILIPHRRIIRNIAFAGDPILFRTIDHVSSITIDLVFIDTFHNISAISQRSALLVEETGVPDENH